MDILAKLNEKIDSLLQAYEEVKKENEALKTENENLKEMISQKEASLMECQEAMALKEIELEEVLSKIEAILGK
jgi:cell division protein ZapB